MNDIPKMDAEADNIDEQIDYQLKQKQALQAQLLTIHRRIRYREEMVQKLALKKTEALQFKLPIINEVAP
jgi:hypothetical protein